MTLTSSYIPELGIPQKGKVRDRYTRGDEMVLITSDRLSVFDRVLPTPVPDKGRVLTEISRYWFDETSSIVQNHLLGTPDPNVMIVKKCTPLKLEVIVRSYLVGSLARDYKSGIRVKCGVRLPDGLKENDPLPTPILTPTTKADVGHDEDITKDALIEQKIVTKELFDEIEKISLALFKKGKELADRSGLILLDTKYEFGLDQEGRLTLIDEVHTPDSSRYWLKSDVEKKQVRFPDKEFARKWAIDIGFKGEGVAPTIPEEILTKIRAGYKTLFEQITGRTLTEDNTPANRRLIDNLKKAGLVKGVFCPLLAGSESDRPHVEKITAVLKEANIPYQVIYASAHKKPREVMEWIDLFNQSLEPLCCITIAGRSNALSGVMAANLKWPVIACPPFSDKSDYLVNIHSTLQMPSNTPSMCVVDPKNAALATIKILEAAR